MTVISTLKIEPKRKLFHNEWINVYQTTLPLEKIEFWKENNRTIFTFERLTRDTGKALNEISVDDVTTFIAEQPMHGLSELSKSIGRNGVQVPMIIRDDGKLLDGNRRFFACHWLKIQSEKQNKEIPLSLSEIPVLVIREEDLTHILELKILTEANFIPDLKISWPLDAQARAVDDYYKTVLKENNLSDNDALNMVISVFSINKTRATDLLDTLELTKKFISVGGDEDERIRRRGIVEGKFVYFWEFLNKTMKGRSRYKDPLELKEVTDMFFSFMAMGANNPIKNVKQIEPLAQAKRDKSAWPMLIESGGSKLKVVVNLLNEKKEVRKAEDKIRLFYDWLEDAGELSPAAKNYLLKLKDLVEKKCKEDSA